MSNRRKILISWACPGSQNSNAYIFDAIVDAAADCVSRERVIPSAYENLARDIDVHRPTIALLVGSVLADNTNYVPLKKICEKVGCSLCFWLTDDPYEIDAKHKFVKQADFIFSNDKYASHFYFRENVHHLPLGGCLKRHYRPLGDDYQRPVELFFCGVEFPNRRRLLRDLNPYLNRHSTVILGDSWTLPYSYIRNERIGNEELIEWYSKSAVVLNIGRRYDLANNYYNLVPSTPGPRTFEAALAGTVQFYFAEDLEIEEYFQPDHEILLFETPVEFGRLLERMRDDPTGCFEIAKASQARARLDHTYSSRLRALLDIVNTTNKRSGRAVVRRSRKERVSAR